MWLREKQAKYKCQMELVLKKPKSERKAGINLQQAGASCYCRESEREWKKYTIVTKSAQHIWGRTCRHDARRRQIAAHLSSLHETFLIRDYVVTLPHSLFVYWCERTAMYVWVCVWEYHLKTILLCTFVCTNECAQVRVRVSVRAHLHFIVTAKLVWTNEQSMAYRMHYVPSQFISMQPNTKFRKPISVGGFTRYFAGRSN